MARVDLKELARVGATARVVAITSELAAIHRAFPALRGRRSGTTIGSGIVEAAPVHRHYPLAISPDGAYVGVVGSPTHETVGNALSLIPVHHERLPFRSR